ncbi:MAG: aldo/keto reductase [Candidatus Latescibacterota bacterium]|nr:aldo/keto reductase [Candidatus Latescibacterota bacterium]
MKFTTFGRTGLRLSRVALGAGGPSRLGFSKNRDRTSMIALIHGAVDLGVNIIDTARNYGTEKIIGEALAEVSEEVFVATKVWCFESEDVHDPNREPYRDPDRLVESVETSLRQLGRETIDILQFHGVPPGGLDVTIDILLPAAQLLRDAGKVRFIGITEHPGIDPQQEMAWRACDSGLFDSIMVQYGIFDQEGDWRTFPTAKKNEVGVFCMCAARNALTTPEAVERVLTQLDRQPVPDLSYLLDEASPKYADAAFRFAASNESIDVVVVGTGNLSHLEASTRAVLGPPTPAAVLDRLQADFGDLAGGPMWPGD